MTTLLYFALGALIAVSLMLFVMAWFLNGVDEIDDDSTHGDTGGWKG